MKYVLEVAQLYLFNCMKGSTCFNENLMKEILVKYTENVQLDIVVIEIFEPTRRYLPTSSFMDKIYFFSQTQLQALLLSKANVREKEQTSTGKDQNLRDILSSRLHSIKTGVTKCTGQLEEVLIHKSRPSMLTHHTLSSNTTINQCHSE